MEFHQKNRFIDFTYGTTELREHLILSDIDSRWQVSVVFYTRDYTSEEPDWMHVDFIPNHRPVKPIFRGPSATLSLMDEVP